jgi:hypothetical protein
MCHVKLALQMLCKLILPTTITVRNYYYFYFIIEETETRNINNLYKIQVGEPGFEAKKIF